MLGPAPYLVMAVLNATPDSFYDGGRLQEPAAAAEAVVRFLRQGADIIDVGGESTRPGAAAVSEDEELARVLPVIRDAVAACKARGESAGSGVRAGLGQVCAGGGAASFAPAVSIDTRKARVAAAALAAGAEIVNDVSACLHDPGLLDVVAQHKPGYVLMHAQGDPETMQKDPRYQDVVAEVMHFFEERMRALTAAGLPEERIVLDPGIGFGKTLEHNLELLRRLGEFLRLGRPLLVGVSNKSLWGALLGLDKHERVTVTMAATAVLWGKGAAIHRVHEPDLAAQALGVARALGRS